MPVSIKDVVNAASGAAILPGQVVKFKEGQVPDDYAQISGPAVSPMFAGAFAVESLRAKTLDVASARIQATSSKLFFTYASGGSVVIQELTSDMQLVAGAMAYVPGLVGSYANLTLVPTPDDRLMRIGGSTSSYLSKDVQTYSPLSKAWVSLAPRTTDAHTLDWKGAFARDNCLYMHNGVSGAVLDKFDYAANTWTYGFDTLPVTGTPVSMHRLASGKLFVVFAAAQYVFDPAEAAGSRWTQVGSVSLSTSTQADSSPTAEGVRIYDQRTVNGEAGCISFHDYAEATGIITTTHTAVTLVGVGSGVRKFRATVNPYTGATHLKNDTYGITYIHYLPYEPAAVVDAVKL